MKLYDVLVELDALESHVLAVKSQVRNAMLDQEIRKVYSDYGVIGETVIWVGDKRKPGEHTRGVIEVFDERVHGQWHGVFGYHHGQLVVRSPRGYRISPYISDDWMRP